MDSHPPPNTLYDSHHHPLPAKYLLQLLAQGKGDDEDLKYERTPPVWQVNPLQAAIDWNNLSSGLWPSSISDEVSRSLPMGKRQTDVELMAKFDVEVEGENEAKKDCTKGQTQTNAERVGRVSWEAAMAVWQSPSQTAMR